MPQQVNWIPVKEKTPRTSRDVLVTFVNSSGRKGVRSAYFFNGVDGIEWLHIPDVLTVTHWAELPPPAEDTCQP